MVRAPVSVAMTTDQTVPINTTNSIAPSLWPNQSSANGIQQTLGRVCSPSAITPTVSSTNCNRLDSRPRGSPIARPIDSVADQQSTQRDDSRLQQRAVV